MLVHLPVSRLCSFSWPMLGILGGVRLLESSLVFLEKDHSLIHYIKAYL